MGFNYYTIYTCLSSSKYRYGCEPSALINFPFAHAHSHLSSHPFSIHRLSHPTFHATLSKQLKCPGHMQKGGIRSQQPPKKCKTQHSKGGSDNEHKAQVDDEVEPRVGKPSKRSRKSWYTLFQSFFLHFFFGFFLSFFFHLL